MSNRMIDIRDMHYGVSEPDFTQPEEQRQTVTVCYEDGSRWPCDAGYLLDTLEAALADRDRLVTERDAAIDVTQRTREALTVCLEVLYGHFGTLHRLALNYPEAQHILASPRKHNSVVLVEQIIHRLDALDGQPQQPAGSGGT